MLVLIGVVLIIISNIPSIENKVVNPFDLEDSVNDLEWHNSHSFNILSTMGIAMVIARLIFGVIEIAPELMKWNWSTQNIIRSEHPYDAPRQSEQNQPHPT